MLHNTSATDFKWARRRGRDTTSTISTEQQKRQALWVTWTRNRIDGLHNLQAGARNEQP